MNYKKLIIILPIIILIVISILIYNYYNKENDINLNIKELNVNFDKYENKTINLTESLSITSGGVYTLKGTLYGNITINTNDNVKLILDNVTIISDNGPAINIENADNVLIYINEGTSNLSDSSIYNDFEDDVDGVIFSRDDLFIEGDGTLILNSYYNDALVSKDSLVIYNGTYIINAKDDAIRGKDYVYIKDGTFTINSINTAIKSTNSKDNNKGFIKIDNGTFNIKTTSTNEDDSSKGLNAENIVLINGGTFNIDSVDDAIHSNNIVKILGGTFNISTNDDGVHADNNLIIEGGVININNSYEGIESSNIVINNGDINIIASDDGINATCENKNSALNIYNGNININAKGDGIDSNGDIYIYDGTIYVNGPTSNGDGALDYDGKLIITGGTLLAIGSSGMAQGISSDSSIYGILVNLTKTYNSGDIITIEDEGGNQILSYTAVKNFSSICYSSNLLKKDNTYTIKINNEEIQTITINNISTTSGNIKGGDVQGVRR